jgi:hypothetical protein
MFIAPIIMLSIESSVGSLHVCRDANIVVDVLPYVIGWQFRAQRAPKVHADHSDGIQMEDENRNRKMVVAVGLEPTTSRM